MKLIFQATPNPSGYQINSFHEKIEFQYDNNFEDIIKRQDDEELFNLSKRQEKFVSGKFWNLIFADDKHRNVQGFRKLLDIYEN